MTGDNFDRNKSIEELSGYCRFAPEFESNVIIKNHAMRRKKLADLTLEDIRMGASQHVGVTHLVPIALKVVEDDPFAESLNFPAEIILKLLLVPHDYWLSHPRFGYRLEQVYERVRQGRDTQDDYWRSDIFPLIEDAHAKFRGEHPSREWLRPLEAERERELWRSDQW